MNSEGMFQELVENFDDILIVTDADFRIRYISSAVTKIFRVEPIKVLGQNLFTYVNPSKIDDWKRCLQDPSHTSFHEEISLSIGKNKKAYFDVQVSNLFNKSNIQGLMLKLHDISDKILKEQELIKSNQQLDQVIYKTTHDLKAPIMSAMGLISLAEKAPASEKDKYIDLIKKSLLRLDSFIEEMNDFFRNEKLAVQRDKINISDLLSGELNDLQSLYEEQKIKVGFEIDGDAEFFSDSLRLRTIIANILSNAIKYCDQDKSQPFINIYVSIDEEFCQIRIVDNGIGIEPQYQEKIFDLFFRATNHSQGTGLGLFIVKDTIEKLKGKIEVNSKSGQGTTFTIQLPNQILQPTEAG
jgi:PAS domain S-box-containing protein